MLKEIRMALAGLLSVVPLAFAQEGRQFTKVAERLVEWINAGNYEAIHAAYSQEMRRAFSLEETAAFYKELSRQHGKLKKLDPPRLAPPGAIFPVQFEGGLMDLTLVLDEHGRISGLTILPHKPLVGATTTNLTELNLPLKGRWLVFWGGDTKALNPHQDVPNQRYAFDLEGVDEQGRTRRGASDKNEDYFAYGREVLAPGDGKVIEVIDGVHENEPGSMNPYSMVGNCVMIEHRENEVSVLCHLQPGSIQVKVGDRVKRGQPLGKCGNSGNSSEPHIHYHLQHSPILQDGLGIKPVFQKVVVNRDGKTEIKTNYSPLKGDIISPE